MASAPKKERVNERERENLGLESKPQMFALPCLVCGLVAGIGAFSNG